MLQKEEMVDNTTDKYQANHNKVTKNYIKPVNVIGNTKNW